MLRQEIVIDKIEILEHGHVQVRKARRVYDGDTLIGESYIRDGALEPGSDVSKADPKVQSVAAAVWTPDVVRAHAERKAALEAKAARGK